MRRIYSLGNVRAPPPHRSANELHNRLYFLKILTIILIRTVSENGNVTVFMTVWPYFWKGNFCFTRSFQNGCVGTSGPVPYNGCGLTLFVRLYLSNKKILNYCFILSFIYHFLASFRNTFVVKIYLGKKQKKIIDCHVKEYRTTKLSMATLSNAGQWI